MQLSDPISPYLRLRDEQKKALNKLGINILRDLLYHFPSRYVDISKVSAIKDLVVGEQVTIVARIVKAKTKKAWKKKIPMAEALLEDDTGKIKALWFNQAYIAKMLPIGKTVALSGRVTESKNGIYLANAEFDKSAGLPVDSHESLFRDGSHGAYIPVYRESRGISSKFLLHAIKKIIGLGALNNIEDPIPVDILKKYSLPNLKTALIWLHLPKREDDAQAARKRFAFEEIFFIQLSRKLDRKDYEKNRSYRVTNDPKDIESFVNRFPFKHTNAQSSAIDTILKDVSGIHPMARLLEGDVGSGKTAVAATASFAVIKNRPDGKTFGNLQVAYMAPTEILATQHFENFIRYFEHTGISVGLITGSGCRKFPSKVASQAGNWTTISRAQLLKWVANGEIPILLGTHALIQKSVKFKHLALAIIDEQHRFGTMQRKKLVTKEGFAPHLLSMTATPIPRTLALTIYGDLDLTLLDEMPEGRKQVITEIVRPDKRDESYKKIKKELEAGRQLYVICPRIDEPDPEKELAVQAKSVTAEAKRLKKEIFPEYEIGILHSKMSKQKKEQVMEEFSSGDIQILCATSVVEVGVNVPNATIIIIEGAERFGLAQLHQLRGRVLRSTHQAYCYLFPMGDGETALKRLTALKTAKNGFELSEMDLELRGAGELSGTKQWGLSDLGMEAIKNIKMVEAARNEAVEIIEKNLLSTYPTLQNAVLSRTQNFHFE